MSDEPKCKSCGVEWDKHLGTEPTCKLLKAEQAVSASLLAENERLKAELSKHQTSEFHPDWSLLNAAQDSIKEANAEIAKLRRRLAEEIKWGHRECTHDNCNSSGTDCPANREENQ